MGENKGSIVTSKCDKALIILGITFVMAGLIFTGLSLIALSNGDSPIPGFGIVLGFGLGFIASGGVMVLIGFKI